MYYEDAKEKVTEALGVLGMLLAPLAAVLARQLWDSGLLHSLFGP